MIDTLTAKKLHRALGDYLEADRDGRRDFDFPGSISSIAGLLYALKIAVLREDDEIARGADTARSSESAKMV
ncbi:hypothetical protein [Aurantimonas coralicida]|uniref:hypothetical protein n=1 Tax=Aurantimonas coralicida TaxID=182270 RepID=UPI0023934968|nr:hypothetical protein [Aurantimonas coralicida]MDE0924923.1 hypothetical protein [Aurantimonas coralicida]